MEYKDGPDEELPLIQEADASQNADKKDELTPTQASPPYQFTKWLNTFRNRKRGPSTIKERYVHGWNSPPKVPSPQRSPPRPPIPFVQYRDQSSPRSSFLGAVRTTTMSTTTSRVTRSRGATSTTNHSTISDFRSSAEIARSSTSSSTDPEVEELARKRREVLKELVLTEVNYVQGLKALTGILSTFNTRGLIQENIQRICGIHEEFLSQLRRVSPLSAENIPTDHDQTSRGVERHTGSITSRFHSRSSKQRGAKAAYKFKAKTISEPSETLEVAREIEKLSESFSEYESFCTNYDLLHQDIAFLRRSVPDWSIYDQGIEALSKSVASTATRKLEENKSLSMNDLMIMPIQRICKYPLILQEMIKNIPATEYPSAHDAIQQIVDDLRILVIRINSATGNPVNKDRIQKTLILQSKIRFSQQDSVRDVYKELGPLVLCGVLHVTYRAPEKAVGDFLVCVLFRSHFLIAKSAGDFHRLDIVACICMDGVTLDALHNKQGLACFECPFSWKLKIPLDDDTYELVLSAASAIEEKHWKTEILKCSLALPGTAKQGGQWDPRQHSYISLNIVGLNIGRVQHTVASLTRRTSMDSMAISRKTQVENVMVRKTAYPHNYEGQSGSNDDKEQLKKDDEPELHLPTIRALRVDRLRLERLMSEVYTRDVLPLPGIALSRGDILNRGIMGTLSLRSKSFIRRSRSMSVTHSGSMVTQPQSAPEEGEDKEPLTALDGDRISTEQDCDSPKTPNSAHSAFRLRYTPKKSPSVSTPHEKSRSQDSAPESLSRKKWNTGLKNVLSPRSPKSPRP